MFRIYCFVQKIGLIINIQVLIGRYLWLIFWEEADSLLTSNFKAWESEGFMVSFPKEADSMSTSNFIAHDKLESVYLASKFTLSNSHVMGIHVIIFPLTGKSWLVLMNISYCVHFHSYRVIFSIFLNIVY